MKTGVEAYEEIQLLSRSVGASLEYFTQYVEFAATQWIKDGDMTASSAYKQLARWHDLISTVKKIKDMTA
jgi:hypothetical protein